MKKKIKVCLGAALFIAGAIFVLSGILFTIEYFDSISGVIGTVGVSIGMFGLYYGALLLGKD